jgi:hypothetical protein
MEVPGVKPIRALMTVSPVLVIVEAAKTPYAAPLPTEICAEVMLAKAATHERAALNSMLFCEDSKSRRVSGI